MNDMKKDECQNIRFKENLDSSYFNFKIVQCTIAIIVLAEFLIIADLKEMSKESVILVSLALVFILEVAFAVVKVIKELIRHAFNEIISELRVMMLILIGYSNKKDGHDVDPYKEIMDTFDWCEKMSEQDV